MHLPSIRLLPKADRRLQTGHLWIYSNEIDQNFQTLKNLAAGDLAIVENARGQTLGVAYINPHTLICGRLIQRGTSQAPNAEFFVERISNALKLRQQLFAENCYRLIYGEGDFLPGLVVDRFNDVLVVQVATAGMERMLDQIITALDQVINPRAILIKNESKMRASEGLENYVRWAKGDPQETAQLTENNVSFIAPIVEGQKTGWFYDHRMNRARLASYVKGKRVLDLFSYVGGWGVQAAAFGAKEVICCDVSDFALQYVGENARINNLENVSTLQGDAFEILDSLAHEQSEFDVIILDPPAFIPRHKDLPKGLAAYQKCNLQAMRLLNLSGGTLFTGSCSMHLPIAELQSALSRAANKLNYNLRILEHGHQGPDHPIHAAIPETEYLKCLIAQV